MINGRLLMIIGVLDAVIGTICYGFGNDGMDLCLMGCFLFSLSCCIDKPLTKKERQQEYVDANYLLIKGLSEYEKEINVVNGEVK
jgi:hypothetical protein